MHSLQALFLEHTSGKAQFTRQFSHGIPWCNFTLMQAFTGAGCVACPFEGPKCKQNKLKVVVVSG